MRRSLPLLLAVGVLVLVVGIEVARPQPPDERLRLERQGTEPFDAEILYALLPDVMEAPVVPVAQTPFEHLADTTLTGTAYLFLADAFEPDPAEAGRLLAYAERGNTVVVSARAVGGALFQALGTADTLAGVPGLRGLAEPLGGLAGIGERDTLRLRTPDGDAAYGFPVWTHPTTFGGVDSTRTDVLGTTGQGVAQPFGVGAPYRVAFVRVRTGRGAVLVHGAPVAFTNAALAPAEASDAAAYLADVLSFVPPVDAVFWDEVYKPLRDPPLDRLSIARRDPALRWAVGLVLLGALFFVAFRGRRWQRPVPVVAPPPNAQREFARVLGRLHLVRGERAWLARRKVRTTRERLRALGLGPDLSDDAAPAAAERAGRSAAEARAFFERLRRLEADPAPTAEDLLELDRAVDAFFRPDAADQAVSR